MNVEHGRTDTKNIGIIGTTGTNAALWTQAFLRDGFEVTSLVRGASAHTRTHGVRYVEFDLDDRATYRPALEAVEILALVTPIDPRQTERELSLIDAAKAAGVQRILNVSVIGSELPAPISPFARWQAPVEAALKASGIQHVTLRPSAYMQNVLLQRAAIEAGSYIEPAGGETRALVDVSDIAAVSRWPWRRAATTGMP